MGHALGALACTVVATLLLCTSAFGTVGAQLTWFVPSPGSGTNGGRGIAISGSTAYISSTDEPIYVVNLATHQTTGTLETKGVVPGGFGALTGDPSGQLWGSEYQNEGWIDKINGAGAVEEIFNAATFDANNTGIDGLSADSDGTLWLKGEGIGATERTVYHVEPNGHVLGSCIVHLDASGIAVNGADMWVASTNGGHIYEYEKKTTGGDCVPVESGGTPVSFPTGEANSETVKPEGLALDHCTFQGHLALWAFGAAFVSGPLVAYDLGPYSGTTTDCPAPPKKEEPTKEEAKKETTSGSGGKAPGLYAGGAGTGGTVVAGAPTLLEYLDPHDPTGLVFTYIWSFGDGGRLTGHARVHHTYKCAGIYKVTVTEIDTTGARKVSSGELAVGFPKSANKSYRGLRFSPHVHVSGHTASAWLSWSGRGKRHIKARTVDWTIDRAHRKRLGISTHAKSSLSLHRNHRLTSTVHFSNRHAATIHACFYA
ncbi:MAG: PKD domain-containing protein [Solirubrobacteraceae bacterium]